MPKGLKTSELPEQRHLFFRLRVADNQIFYFAAFDEAWKVGDEGDVGAYWGLWDKEGLPKYS